MTASATPADDARPGAWLGRMLLAAGLVGTIVGLSVALAWWWSPPRRDAGEQARAALDRAFERGEVAARDLYDERWTAVFAFGPLTTPASIRMRLGGRDLSGDMARVGAHERLLVFADEDRVVASARLHRGTIESGCLSAGRPLGVPPDTPIRIIAMRVRGRQVLVAAEAATPEIAACLRTLPRT